MDVSVESYASFTVGGIGITTDYKDAPKTIPPLWERFYEENIVSQLSATLDETVVYGVYSQYESDEKGCYHLLAGTEVQEGTLLVSPFETISVPLSRYLVCHIKRREEIIDAWMKIWQSQIKRRFSFDFERYGPDGIDIYVSIEDDNQTDKAIISGF